MIQTKKIQYLDEHTLLEGFYAVDDHSLDKKPAILIAHDWSGCNDFARKKAVELAELGYIGFAIDMFGKDKIGKTNEEKMALIKPFMENRTLLRQRIQAALTTLIQQEQVNANSIGAIGFCFGGLCVLDLARSGAKIRGVVSFHGLLNAPVTPVNEPIQAKILVLHGHDDPMAPPAQVAAFQEEMTAANTDWQTHIYGQTKHAFMNPAAHDQTLGTVYNELAAKRSWTAMRNFFVEIFKV